MTSIRMYFGTRRAAALALALLVLFCSTSLTAAQQTTAADAEDPASPEAKPLAFDVDTNSHWLAQFVGIKPASVASATRVCFNMKSTRACNPLASKCCAAGSKTKNADAIAAFEIKPASDAVACMTKPNVPSWRKILWTLNGKKVSARYVKKTGLIRVRRRWQGNATLCVEIPANNPCQSLEKICGSANCAMNVTTVRFAQQPANPLAKPQPKKRACKILATVPLQDNSQGQAVNPCDALPCGGNSVCTVDAGAQNGFTCACLPGFTSQTGASCTDIDECSAAPGGNPCGSNTICTNTVGGFTCACEQGFTSPTADGRNCTDINECSPTGANNCSGNATCTNTAGGFQCVCNQGYDGDGVTCTDINECLPGGANNCSANATCTNTAGGFTCACKAGYDGDGVTCNNVDECLTNNGGCSADATCTDTDGSFTCSCNAGYDGDGFICNDVDECALGTDACSQYATCTNTIGNYTCACKAGFTGDGFTCTDVNECQENTDNCDVNALCTNTIGNYTCACKAGYDGDGFTCGDVDECALGTDACSQYATCTNTIGNYTCACKAGFDGDGFTCTNINECLTNNGGCSVNATCIDTIGNYTCTCKPGYTGDGITCTEKPCVPILGTCTVSSDCCGSSSNTTQTFCESGVCRFVPNGSCYNPDSECGKCASNCGGDEKKSVCNFYWNSETVCNTVSASGGGGNNAACGNSQTCCVITAPTDKVVRPTTSDECFPKY